MTLWFRRQFFRFVAVGLVNTIIGYSTIMVLDTILKNAYTSNVLGYLLTSAISYLNHSRYTFRKRLAWQRAVLYGILYCLSLLANLAVLHIALRALIPTWLAQLLAMATYIILSYILLSRYGFSDRFYSD